MLFPRNSKLSFEAVSSSIQIRAAAAPRQPPDLNVAAIEIHLHVIQAQEQVQA